MADSDNWDFTKLPASEHDRTVKAYQDKDIAELIAIHDQYKLSHHVYCCGPGVPASVYSWFEWGIENVINYD